MSGLPAPVAALWDGPLAGPLLSAMYLGFKLLVRDRAHRIVAVEYDRWSTMCWCAVDMAVLALLMSVSFAADSVMSTRTGVAMWYTVLVIALIVTIGLYMEFIKSRAGWERSGWSLRKCRTLAILCFGWFWGVGAFAWVVAVLKELAAKRV